MANAFRIDELDGKIGLVTFDLPDKKVNTLSQEVLKELAGLVGQLEQRTDLRGLLFTSGKPGQFVAGADLNELAMMSYAKLEQVAGLTTMGHQLYNRISRLPFPTVALIDGGCLGGGTELVLTMDERLVSTAPHTQISLPEVSDRHPARLGRHAALAALDRPQRRHRSDLRGREALGPEGRDRGLRVRRGPGRKTGRGRAPADRVFAAERRVESTARAAARAARA